MAYDLSATLGLDASGMVAGAQTAENALSKVRGSVGALARQLERQKDALTLDADGILAKKIAGVKNDEHRHELTAMLQHNRHLQAQKAILAEVEREQQRVQAAEKSRIASINQIVDASLREAAALGKTNAELKVMQLQSLGASKAQIAQVKQAENMIAVQQRLQAAQGQFGGMGRLLLGGLGVVGTGSVLKLADEWTTLTNRLKLVHSTSEDVAKAQKGIVEIAKKTGSDLGSTAQVYQRFAQNAQSLGISNEEVLRLSETVSKAVAIGGGSAESASAGLMQFGQALASGILRGEELNSIMEQTPGLSQALATGLGVPIGKLREMGKEGQLTADVVIAALQKASGKVDADFGKTSFTIAQAMTNVKTSVMAFIGGTGEATGAAKLLAGSLQFVADNTGLLATGLIALVGVGVVRWAVMSGASLIQLVAAQRVASAGAAALSASSLAQGGAMAFASASATGFAGSLTLLRGAALMALPAVKALWATIAPFAAIAAAVVAGGTGLVAMFNALRGADASNWISDWVNGFFGLDKTAESIGTKIYDWLHPIDDVTKRLDLAQRKLNAIAGTSSYQSKDAELAKHGGSVAQHHVSKMKTDDAKGAIQDLVIEYRKQAQQMMMSKEQQDAYNLSLYRNKILMDEKTALEAKYKNDPERDAKIAADLAATQRELDRDTRAVVEAMTQAEQAVKAKAAADKAAANRKEVESSLQSWTDKLAQAGKSAEQLEIMSLAAKGATDAEQAKVRAIMQTIDAYEKQQDAMKTVESWQKELRQMGMSDSERKLDDLQTSGADKTTLALAKAVLAQTEARKLELQRKNDDSKVSGWDVQKAQAAAYNAQREYEAIARQNGVQTDANTRSQDLQTAAIQQNTAAVQAANVPTVQAAQSVPSMDLSNAASLFDSASNVFARASEAFAQNVQRFSPQGLGQITLDLRFPSGKALTGILFGSPEFLTQFKQASAQSLEQYIAQAAAKLS